MAINNRFILYLSLTIISFFNVLTISCQSKKMEKKFDWSATLSAPQEYPIQVYKGKIIANDYEQSLEGFGVISYGWGTEGGIVVMGPDQKNVPEKLEITWRSFVEQKNYQGKWTLPKEKLVDLLNEGFTNEHTKKKETYNTIIVGLAPKGLVVVWLQGSGHQVELCKFMAQETEIDLKTVGTDDQHLFDKNYSNIVLEEGIDPKVKEKIKNEGYPEPEIYELYSHRYNSKPTIILPEGSVLSSLSMSFYNGEREMFFKDNVAKIDYNQRAILKYLNAYWHDKNNTEYGIWIESFDEEEMQQAYQNLGKESKIDATIQILNNSKINVILKNKEKEIIIKNYKMTIE
jgi:Protein of unknown function (DUF2931)